MANISATTFLYGILAGMLPSFLWLWFWLKEDNLHRESRTTLAGCFLAGMIAVIFALFFEWVTENYITQNTDYQYIIWAGIEETLKFLAAFIVVFGWKKMHEPVDAMIYMITTALGFSAVENTLFLFGAINTSTILSTVVTGNMRFIGATLLHVVTSAIIGFMLAITYYHSKLVKFIATTVGLAIAISLHAAFNLAIITSTTEGVLIIFAWVWAGAIVIILLFEEVKGVEAKHNNLQTIPQKIN